MGLKCYKCDDCNHISPTTETMSCSGEEDVSGFLMPLKCVTTRRMTGLTVSVKRTCEASVIDGCVNTESEGTASALCYCSEDLCNNQGVGDMPDPPPDSQMPAAPLTCYNCIDCPEVSSSTPTKVCDKTGQVSGGGEFPVKCGTIKFYDSNPDAIVVRLCSPSKVEGCMNIEAEGAEAIACYCSKDFCNSDPVTEAFDPVKKTDSPELEGISDEQLKEEL